MSARSSSTFSTRCRSATVPLNTQAIAGWKKGNWIAAALSETSWRAAIAASSVTAARTSGATGA
jgi:hypothetical protein